jgi:dihydrofolate synthase/folylpolyglutamate synthase
VRIPLVGAHQARNAALAAELLGVLPDDVRPSWEAIEAGFAEVRWAGRMQVVRQRGGTWIFDVAHNPAGVATLVETLRRLDPPRPLLLLSAILSDKSWREMLTPLLRACDGAILTLAPTAPEARRWDPLGAAEWAAAETGLRPRVIEDLGAALQRAETLAPHGTILVTGSVHTVGDAMALLGMAT